jgi:hypothetical protein
MPGSNQKKSKSIQAGLFDSHNDSSPQKKAPDQAVMYCDGACSGNPGKSGIGAVIYIPGDEPHDMEENEIYRISEYIGIATNNIAEYTAFVRGNQCIYGL